MDCQPCLLALAAFETCQEGLETDGCSWPVGLGGWGLTHLFPYESWLFLDADTVYAKACIAICKSCDKITPTREAVNVTHDANLGFSLFQVVSCSLPTCQFNSLLWTL